MSATMAAESWQLDSASLPALPRTYVQQNFTSFYTVDTERSPGNDLAFRLHANGLCVVALAPSHAALGSSGEQAAAAGRAAPATAAAEEPLRDQQAAAQPQAAAASECVARLAFGPKLLQAEFRKGRGPLLHADTILGRLAAGGHEFVLRCGVRGLLVELNPRLQELQGAALLRELQRGYLAILDVRAAEASVLAGRCLAEDAYQQRLLQRPRAPPGAELRSAGEQAGEQQQLQTGAAQCAKQGAQQPQQQQQQQQM